YQVFTTYTYTGLHPKLKHRTTAYANALNAVADEEIDPNTGLVSIATDGIGLTTQYEYDSLGRMVWTKPLSGAVTRGASTHFSFTDPNPDTLTRAKAEVAIVANPADTTL